MKIVIESNQVSEKLEEGIGGWKEQCGVRGAGCVEKLNVERRM